MTNPARVPPNVGRLIDWFNANDRYYSELNACKRKITIANGSKPASKNTDDKKIGSLREKSPSNKHELVLNCRKAMNTVFQKNNSDSKTKDGSRFNHANDSGMTLKDAEFIEKNSEELLAKLKREAAANKFSLRGIDLSGIVFGPESDFSGLDLRGAIFDNCDLTGASFDGANLEGASFKNVVAIGTTFINARMLNANLSDGNFRDSDFTDADLKQTNVWGAAFYEVTFQRTDIRGAYWKDTYETEVMHEDDEIRSLSGECDKQSSPRALSFDEQSWPHAPSFDL